ncbi:methyltransferase domain protein [Synechococcus sp. A18-46.1]|nr:methyltransferase domain protein [Synechococcus sp. A18-46.1]
MHFNDLCVLGLTSKETAQLFRNKTRDNSNLEVYRDNVSGVIFIKDFQVESSVYSSGDYFNEPFEKMLATQKLEDLGHINDRDRRLQSFKQFYVGKSIVDFGCGAGDFLIQASKYTKKCLGVELQESHIKNLGEAGIHTINNLSDAEDDSIDSIFFFHSFEHLNSPIDVLNQAYQKLSPGGKIIIEVPNAKDFLITYNVDEFIDFTLWSQHLILHTHRSIQTFLENSNFKDVITTGVQRFPLSNHMTWLFKRKPGGHFSTLSAIDTPTLNEAYADALGKLGANDTIVCIGEK